MESIEFLFPPLISLKMAAWMRMSFLPATMESISGEQLREDVTALLRRCTGDPSLRAPVRVVRSEWVTDPLYLGAYSYGAIDSEFPQNQVRPHKNVL